MAKKRFNDIEIWDKEWYMVLKPKHKCLMKYIFDRCDACGCWKPNWKLATLHIGEDVNFIDLSSLPKDQYEVLENGKIFIPDFINFQYGKLSKKSPAHNPVFSAIEKNGLSNRVFNRVLDTLQEKDIYKDKEKEEEKNSKKNFKKKPIFSDFNGLPEMIIGSVIQLLKITQQTNISNEQVNGLWEVFKVQNLTGEKYYQDEQGVYSHFINWSKTQKIQNNATGTRPNSTTKFNEGALQLLAKGKEKFAAIRREQAD